MSVFYHENNEEVVNYKVVFFFFFLKRNVGEIFLLLQDSQQFKMGQLIFPYSQVSQLSFKMFLMRVQEMKMMMVWKNPYVF